MTQTQNKPRKKQIITILVILFILIIAAVIGCTIYVRNYYHTDTEAVSAMTTPYSGPPISISVLENDTIIYEPEDADTGLIFYPGGKVEYTAYEPLMQELASEGILCILVKMPANLAVLDVKAADGFQADYPDIDSWYIGGHSLGGSMAASYLADNTDDYEGLILLGSYSTADLSQTDLDVLSVYGSEDTVLDRTKYEENKSNLPDDFTEIVISGGCHAYFGVYGPQEGDGTPSISNKEQLDITADAVINITE